MATDGVRKLSRKDAIYRVLNGIGVNALFRLLNRKKVRIFALHGVSNYSMEHPWVPLRQQMDVNDLRELLTVLTAKYHFVSIGEAVEILRGESPIVDNVAVLTFDDGYRNNFTHALPVLEEFGVPGAFYLATGLVESREPFWVDRLDYLLQVAAEQGISFEVAGRTFELHSDDRRKVAAVYEDLRLHCKKYFADDKDFNDALSGLADQLERDIDISVSHVLNSDEWAAVVSAEEIPVYAQRDLVTLGGHTVSHLRLSFSTTDEITRELTDSKNSIEAWSDRDCLHFAYPNGAFNDHCADLVERTGYRSAVTMRYGLVAVGDNPYTLNRLSLPSNFRIAEILARASGLELAIMKLKSVLKRLKKAVIRS